MSVTPDYTINVAGLAAETTEEKLHDFFSFCGKLVSVKKTGSTATIQFEKLSAMRTSLMLNGGTLDGAHLEVTAANDVETKTPSVLPTGATGSTPIGASGEISQEDKPKAAIIAEYLAHGYVLGDHVVQRAIDFDHKQGISNRFLSFFTGLDHTVGEKVVGEDKTISGKLQEAGAAVYAKTREVDQKGGVSAKFAEYYNKVVGTPVGQKVHSFYTSTQKQVLDVHEEARRIAAEKKAAETGATGDVKTAETATPTTAPLVSAVAPQ
ncbi:hypothetical protein BCR39DRAFT_532563 [Naematelia encephala]|uniref:RRM domain-containing protein n=1 Tax=Naematelia encephala TaxID=71784 RepID=A0A1Y2B3Q9_9TREE|nr:hypothetical protein BCR39DRAFT_532563 [Naematelia encephala]